jgi:MFS family permease
MTKPPETRTFYGWWIVAAAFLNLFFVVGIIFYGFPVFYPALIESLHFTRSQVTQGFLLGMLIVGLPTGLLAGAFIDRIGARSVILAGIGFTGASLLLMGSMTRFWHYELLCVMEILGLCVGGTDRQSVLVAGK